MGEAPKVDYFNDPTATRGQRIARLLHEGYPAWVNSRPGQFRLNNQESIFEAGVAYAHDKLASPLPTLEREMRELVRLKLAMAVLADQQMGGVAEMRRFAHTSLTQQPFDATDTEKMRHMARMAALTPPATGEGALRKALEGSLAAIDAATAACPVMTSRKFLESCPKCGATMNQNCGPNITALGELEVIVRRGIAAYAAGRAAGGEG